MKKHYLIRLSSPLPEGEGEARLPTEIQLSPYGWVETETQGKYLMDQEAMAAIEAVFRRSAREVVIDYEHQTLYGREAPAAGWCGAILKKGEQGLWAAPSWTERAAGYLSRREYRYLSPVFLVRKTDRRPVQLHSVALTNSPEIRGLLPLVAGQRFNLFSPEEDPMRERLIQMLKLKADATDEEIEAAVKVMMPDSMPIAHKQIFEALGLSETASLSEVTGTILALKQPGNVVTMEEFKQLKKELAKTKRDEQVGKALKEGKITPAQKEWAEEYALRDPEGFEVFVNKAPVVVPLDRISRSEDSRLTGGELDETQAMINKQLGIAPEVFKKYHPQA